MLHRFLPLMLVFPAVCLAQSPSSTKSQWTPSRKPHAALNLRHLVVAKISTDKQQLLLLVPRPEIRSREINQTVMVPELRERTSTTKDGKQETVSYTVQVPQTKTTTQQYEGDAFSKIDRIIVPIDKVRAWKLSGEKLDTSSLSTSLASPTQIFVLETDFADEYTGSDPYYANVFRANTILVYVPPRTLERKKSSDTR